MYYQATAVLPQGAVALTGVETDLGLDTAVSMARERLGLGTDSVVTAEVLQPPWARSRETVGSGPFVLRLFAGSQLIQERRYTEAVRQRQAAITYLLQGYRVGIAKEPERKHENDGSGQ